MIAHVRKKKKNFFNADDFGISEGVNRGIREVLEDGRVVRSVSLMPFGPAAHEVREITEFPRISIGLHVDFTGKGSESRRKAVRILTWPKRRKLYEFEEQLCEFQELTNKENPDHFDFHGLSHISPSSRQVVMDYAREHGIPVRSVDYKLNLGFHGRTWRHGNVGRGITPKSLMKLMDRLRWGTHEIISHPGYPDKGLIDSGSKYVYPRETEIYTLRSPEVIDYLAANTDRIEIINSKQI